MIRLEVGRVLRFADEDRYERLLWRPKIADGFFCIDIHGSYAAPRFDGGRSWRSLLPMARWPRQTTLGSIRRRSRR